MKSFGVGELIISRLEIRPIKQNILLQFSFTEDIRLKNIYTSIEKGTANYYIPEFAFEVIRN